MAGADLFIRAFELRISCFMQHCNEHKNLSSMKQILTVLFISLLGLPIRAESIVGKWYCPKSFMDSLSLGFYMPNIEGYYQFENDSMFTLRIEGYLLSASSTAGLGSSPWKNPKWMRRGPKQQSFKMEVKGNYRMDGNAITTTVDLKNVDIDIDPGLNYPEVPGAWASWGEYYWKNSEFNRAEQQEIRAIVHERTIRRERIHVLRWNNLPVKVTSEGLQVGESLTFPREKPDFEKIMEMEESRPHLSCRNTPSMEAYDAKEKLRRRKGSAKRLLKAVRTLEKEVKHDSCAFMLYYIGAAYADGIAGKPDSAKALMYLTKAAQARYSDAYSKLGSMYRQGKGGVAQDFSKAYYYYSKGADLEDKDCMYYKGYMLTKGLGCKQSYEEAVHAFLPAANWPDAKSLYMLGVFLRNGYGVEKDIALASNSLKRAAKMRCKEASEELARKHEETFWGDENADDGIYSSVPDSMPEIRPSAGINSLTPGNYSGCMVTYDWSGKHIIDGQPLKMTVTAGAYGMLSGVLTVGTDTTSYSGALTAGTIRYSDGGLTLSDRYVRGGKMAYRLDSMALSSEEGKLCGRLSLYSPKLKEPGRPMYVEFTKDSI